MNRRKFARACGFVCAVLILVLAIYSGLRAWESATFSDGNQERPNSSKTITKDGVDYFPRQDLSTLLILGVYQDASGSGEEQCDTVMLLIFDETNEKIRILNLDPGTIVNIQDPQQQESTVYGQLSEAYGYGEDAAEGCEIICQTVSEYLYGIDISRYLSVNMEAIEKLTDAVGGVMVTVKEDFSTVDSGIAMGETLLSGEQAVRYLQFNPDDNGALNTSRMERQQEFAKGFLASFRKAVLEDNTLAFTAFEQITRHVVTNTSVTSLAGMMQRYSGYELERIVSPEGERVQSDGSVQFHADQEKLEELILGLLFEVK